VTPFCVNTRNGERAGQAPRTRAIDAPLLTTTAAGSQGAVVAAFLAKNYTGVVGSPLDAPLGTVTAIDHHSLVAAHVSKLYGTSTGTGLDEPLHTRHALVAAFLLKYYGEGGQWSGVDEPMHTIVTKARMGLVTVTIDGEEYVIVDIGFRMLEPRELARAQGLPDDYEITGTKEQQIARIGNSVCPDVPAALVRANMLRSGA
jgi:DNA (cytosine-5)-methyltransferase 1